MATFKVIRHALFLSFIFLLFVINGCLAAVNVNGVNLPVGGRIALPTQVLLPPHREEGQSIDDILYGFPPPSRSFGFGSRVTTSSRPPPPPSPPSTTTLATTTTTAKILTSTTLPPVKVSFNQNQNRAGNLVQSFTPPPPPVPKEHVRPSFTPSTSSSFQRHSPNSNSASFFSKPEEIKIPQTVKHRTSQRKQYTKADLIAAANSLKPAGFDFNKVLIFTPGTSNFNGSMSTALAKTAREDVTSSNSLSSIYEHVRFPLPLFDTPVFNELRPYMEMLLRQHQLQQQGNGVKSTNLSNNSVENKNNKVLLIIPKNKFPAARSAGGNNGGVPQQQSSKSQNLHQHHQNHQNKSVVIPSSSTQQSKFASPSTSKFIIVPKGGKHTTTNKPKTFGTPSFGSPTTTTKRVLKHVGATNRATPPSTTKSTTTKKVIHQSTKGPDLQVAATSNKLSKRPSGASDSASSSSSVGSEKRTFSHKGDDKYSFSYHVKNDAFGDVKSHSESRDGEKVVGEYSMLESDGYTRVVRYTVDSDQGFKASVKRIPPS